ncbi:MAG: class B sortase [Acetatifactor sp.]|nr:class B sortase [Acetatifactor sp.]
MEENRFTVSDRRFRTESDYKKALRDAEIIDRLKLRIENKETDAKTVLSMMDSGKINFLTILGNDFREELEDEIAKKQENPAGSSKQKKKGNSGNKKETEKNNINVSDEFVMEQIARDEKKRRAFIMGMIGIALLSFLYLGIYHFYEIRTAKDLEKISERKDSSAAAANVVDDKNGEEVVIHYTDEDKDAPEVLDEYKNLLNTYKKLIGWLKIADTSNGEVFLDVPVVQTTDNDYYLNHNLNQEYDKNGSIFMDAACDVIKGNTNYILYGHHMRSGKMFGKLDNYEKQDFYEKHKTIEFDTIYEKGTYEVMYVFRSKVYSEEEITFKYYQFIDANSPQEFDSYMNEMAEMSLIDTGVTAEYGDSLLTLSTCDYQENNGRFVVVAKKVAAKE